MHLETLTCQELRSHLDDLYKDSRCEVEIISWSQEHGHSVRKPSHEEELQQRDRLRRKIVSDLGDYQLLELTIEI